MASGVLYDSYDEKFVGEPSGEGSLTASSGYSEVTRRVVRHDRVTETLI